MPFFFISVGKIAIYFDSKAMTHQNSDGRITCFLILWQTLRKTSAKVEGLKGKKGLVPKI